jgi:hypothetical protein
MNQKFRLAQVLCKRSAASVSSLSNAYIILFGFSFIVEAILLIRFIWIKCQHDIAYDRCVKLLIASKLF